MHSVVIWEAGVGSSCRVLCDSCHKGNLDSGLGFAICAQQQLAFTPWFPLKCPPTAALYILQSVVTVLFFSGFLSYKSVPNKEFEAHQECGCCDICEAMCRRWKRKRGCLATPSSALEELDRFRILISDALPLKLLMVICSRRERSYPLLLFYLICYYWGRILSFWAARKLK